MKTKYFSITPEFAHNSDEYIGGYSYGEVSYDVIDELVLVPDAKTLSKLPSVNNSVVEGLKEKYVEDKIAKAGITSRNPQFNLHIRKFFDNEELSNALINDGIKLKQYYNEWTMETQQELETNDERIIAGTMVKIAEVMNQMHETSKRLVDTIANLSNFYQNMQERKFQKELELKNKNEIDKFHSLIFGKIEQIQKFINESIRNGLIIDTSVVDNILFLPINIQMLKNMVIRYYETIVQEKFEKDERIKLKESITSRIPQFLIFRDKLFNVIDGYYRKGIEFDRTTIEVFLMYDYEEILCPTERETYNRLQSEPTTGNEKYDFKLKLYDKGKARVKEIIDMRNIPKKEGIKETNYIYIELNPAMDSRNEALKIIEEYEKRFDEDYLNYLRNIYLQYSNAYISLLGQIPKAEQIKTLMTQKEESERRKSIILDPFAYSDEEIAQSFGRVRTKR